MNDAELISQAHKVSTYVDARGSIASQRVWPGNMHEDYHLDHHLKHHGQFGQKCHVIRRSILNRHNAANTMQFKYLKRMTIKKIETK